MRRIFAKPSTPLVAVTAMLTVTALLSAAPAYAQQRFNDDPPDATAGGEVDFDVFHRELAPYGRWFEHNRWGYVWRPDVDENWRPYTRGHWANTEEYGWYWVAEEPWGWAPFHYGRWVFDDNEDEWLWIPGRDWAPAWVQWRESDEAIGWAPLPPDAEFTGSDLSYNLSLYDSPRYHRYWTFVAPSLMFVPGMWHRIYPRSTYATYFSRTRPVRSSYSFSGRRIFHTGIDWRRIERSAGRTVPIVRPTTVTSPRGHGWRNAPERNVVPIYRPRFVPSPNRTPASDITRRHDGGRSRFDADRRRGDGDDRPRSGPTDRGRSEGSRDGKGFGPRVTPTEPAPRAQPPTPSDDRRGGDRNRFGGDGRSDSNDRSRGGFNDRGRNDGGRDGERSVPRVTPTEPPPRPLPPQVTRPQPIPAPQPKFEERRAAPPSPGPEATTRRRGGGEERGQQPNDSGRDRGGTRGGREGKPSDEDRKRQ